MAVLTASVLVLSGCGSDDDSGSPSANQSSGPPLSGEPVVLGVITDETGSTGTKTGMRDTAERWVEYVNNNGGLDGRPVEVIVKDTKNNAATALQAAKDLVENENVVAIGDDSFVNTAYAEYLTKAKVPAISTGAGAVTFNYLSDSNFFSPTANVMTALWGLGKAAALEGKHQFGYLYCAEIAACKEAVPIVTDLLGSVESDMAYSAGFSASAPNYTAQCLAAKDAGTDALLAGGSVETANLRVYTDCAKQGYQPLTVLSVSTSDPAILRNPLVPEAVGVTPTYPWFDGEGAGPSLFRDVMGDYLDEDDTRPKLAANAWTGLQFFAKAVTASGAKGAITPQDVYQGLYTLKDETLEGLVPPFTVTEGQPGSAKCVYAFKSSSGELSMLNDDEPICQEDSQ